MWSYYAEKHKGMCLGFDVHKDVTREIEYVPELLVVGNLIVEKLSDFDAPEAAQKAEQIVERVIGSKYQAWAYEQEVRVHHERDEIDEETKMHFKQFNQRLILKEVIAGARFPFSKKLIEDALVGCSGLEDVKIVKLRCSNAALELVVDESR
jgi:hypothetical protein